MERDAVYIRNVNQMVIGDQRRLSGEVDNELIWFDFPIEFEFDARGEVFIAAALLEAMISNLPIVLDDDIAVSPTLLKNLDTLQNIYHCWNNELNKVQVKAKNIVPSVNKQGMASFFSGGVDGSYSFCKHKEDITHLVVISGFDTIEKEHQWESLIQKHQYFVEQFDKELVCINNNLRQFMNKRKISYAFQHGLTLAGIGITLGFEKVIIPSSFTYSDLFPWGSHPATDPLWSLDNIEVIHDGADVTRAEKIEFIGDFPQVLDNLQVCWANLDHNCGVCSKCLRTKAALHLLGLKSQSLTSLNDISSLKSLKLTGQAGVPFIEDLIVLAVQNGHKDIAKIFKRIYRRYMLKHHFDCFTKNLLGDKFRFFIHKIRKSAWVDLRVTMTSKKSIK